MTPSTIIYQCGCTSVLPIPLDMNIVTLCIEEPGGQGRFEIEILRLSANPPVFMEGGTPRPEWAKWCHQMIWFDVTVFAQANWKEFDHLFKDFRERFGPMVPQCWLPDIARGSGRFYGLWKFQTQVPGRPIQHLRLVEPFQEAPTEPIVVPTLGPPLAT